jgi:hypothetical protein
MFPERLCSLDGSCVRDAGSAGWMIGVRSRVESCGGLCSGFHVHSETGGRYIMLLIALYNTQTLCVQWYRSYLRRCTEDVQYVHSNTMCASVTGLKLQLYKAVVIRTRPSDARLDGFRP